MSILLNVYGVNHGSQLYRLQHNMFTSMDAYCAQTVLKKYFTLRTSPLCIIYIISDMILSLKDFDALKIVFNRS